MMSGLGDPSGTRLAPRCIWVEPEVREWLAIRIEKGNGAERTLCRLLAAKYDAAPADPLAAIIEARNTIYPDGIAEINGDLRALGFPTGVLANPANEEHHA